MTATAPRVRNPSRFAITAIVALASLSLTACPSKIESGSGQQAEGAGVSEDDPRVERDTDDLYTKGSAPTQAEPGLAPGSGRPDETNGVCRLYAPKLSDPECCPNEYGFDAERAKELCGLPVYLGESLHHSCGYHFLTSTSEAKPKAIRLSRIAEPDTKTAAEEHDERIQVRLRQPQFESTPVPGVPDAYWSTHEGLHWAFIPGWDTPRQVSWADGTCSDEAMAKLLGEISAAKAPPDRAPRPGLIPVARK